MTQSAYFDEFTAIKAAVSQRLLAKTEADLPQDGSAGPMPFDIEPLEKWLFEAYVRHYKDDVNRRDAFWVGFADALEKLLTTGTQNVECISRCAELLEHISNDPKVANVKKESFVDVNRLLARPLGPIRITGESEALQIKTALLKIALFTTQPSYLTSVLQTEVDLRATVSLATSAMPLPSAQLITDAICWLFRAWSYTGNRDLTRRSVARQWCTATPDHLERLLHCTKAMERVMTRLGAKDELVIWTELVSSASNVPPPPSAPTARRVPTPNYALSVNRRSASINRELEIA